MPPILGNAIALLGVALLVAACARNLRRDAKQGGCAGCAGCSRKTCAECQKSAVIQPRGLFEGF